MRSSFWSDVFSRLFSFGSHPPIQDPWVLTGVITLGFILGLVLMAALILIGKYFLRWGYEEISIRRGKDSWGSNSPVLLRGTRRRRRRHQAGIKRGGS